MQMNVGKGWIVGKNVQKCHTLKIDRFVPRMQNYNLFFLDL